jgi:hypothetical protein
VPIERFPQTLTAGDFRNARSSLFRLSGGPSPAGYPPFFDAELTDVTDYPAGPPDAARTPFAVLFRGPAEPVMPQGTYRVEHEQLGALELFIVPVGPAPDEASTGMCYEAVFS